MKIKYNAPITLTFAIVSTVVFLVSRFLTGNLLIGSWFSVGGIGSFSFGSLQSWVTLFTYVLGHSSFEHLIGNLMLLLLLGPLLEQSYGEINLLIMILITALVAGVLNVLIFPTGLLGASGIVFMMILLASFTNFGKGEVPLTFILVVLLWLGKEVWSALMPPNDNISQFAHIIGGFCGALFGFLRPAKR